MDLVDWRGSYKKPELTSDDADDVRAAQQIYGKFFYHILTHLIKIRKAVLTRKENGGRTPIARNHQSPKSLPKALGIRKRWNG